MSLTAADLALRKQGMSATDVVTIATAGDGGYGSPLEVYLSKTTDAPGWAGNLRTEMGHAAEPVIMRELAKVYGLALVPSPTVRSRIVPHFLATPDRLAIDAKGTPVATVEGKLVGYRMVRRWYDDDALVFPDEVAIQVAWQQGVMRSAEGFEHSRVDRGYIGALLGDFGEEAFHHTVMPWEGAVEELWLQLSALVDEWWKRHVVAGVPPTPDGSARTREALEKMYPAFRKPVLAPASAEAAALMARLVEVRAAKNGAEAEQELIGNQLRALIGAAGAEGLRSAEHKCSWKAQAGKVSVEKIRAHLNWSEDDLDPFRGEQSRVLRVTALSKKDRAYAATVHGLTE